MSVISARRRRELARAVSGAGLAAALAGSALVAGAMLPTASAAVDPGDPIPGTIFQPGDGSSVGACERLLEAEDLVALYSQRGGDAENEFFKGESDVEENVLDVAVVDPEFKVRAVYVRGPQQNYHAFVGDPYLEGDDLLEMYAPEAPDDAEPTDDTEAADEPAALDEDAQALGDDLGTSGHKYHPYPPEKKINHWLVCGEKVDEPEPELELAILEPVCDNDVPYLEYVVDPQGTDVEDGDVTVTWINPDGDDVVYADLPLEGRVLWVGAEVDDEGNPLDWPGWTQLDDGTWVEGDEFDWVRPSVELLVEVNPEFELTVGYPPSSPLCDANPPQNPPGDEPPGETLPNTGGNALLAVAGGGLVLGGAALLLLGRRSARNRS